MRLARTLLAATLLTASGAQAAETPDSEYGDFAIYAGQFSTFRSSQFETEHLGLEYRWEDQYHGLRPVVGIWGNGDSATYAYGGIYWDLPLGPFMITPGVAVGPYSHGDSKDLGHWIEFRDTIEITYRFDSGQRLGAQLTHFSNAGIGDSNPGVEMVQVVYTHPVW